MTPLPRRKFLTGAGAAALGGAAAAAVPGTAFAMPDPAGRVDSVCPPGHGHTPPHQPPGRSPYGAVQHVTTGVQRLHDSGYALLKGQKVGVISNPTGVLSDYSHFVDSAHESGALNIVAVFGPEHGFRGTAQAGSSEGTSIDPRTGITVYDAYGADQKKFETLFTTAGVETVVFDIQNIDARFYTYTWTMYNAMCAAAVLGKRFVVLDRPNPTGGYANGPMMTTGFTSGVGQELVLQKMGLTSGEQAKMFDAEYLPADCNGKRLGKNLTVVEVKGWTRDVTAQHTDAPWVLPSPNIPTPDSAVVYNGMCWFEATNFSEGRGTTRPFEIVGAPYIDYHWADELRKLSVPGVIFREAYFTPTTSKNENVLCGGAQVQITDPLRIDPILAATHMIVLAKKLYPKDFDWRGDGGAWMGNLSGSDRFKDMLDAGATAEQIAAAWKPEVKAWNKRRTPYLIYPEGHTQR